jgi:hypothetical protein
MGEQKVKPIDKIRDNCKRAWFRFFDRSAVVSALRFIKASKRWFGY